MAEGTIHVELDDDDARLLADSREADESEYLAAMQRLAQREIRALRDDARERGSNI